MILVTTTPSVQLIILYLYLNTSLTSEYLCYSHVSPLATMQLHSSVHLLPDLSHLHWRLHLAGKVQQLIAGL